MPERTPLKSLVDLIIRGAEKSPSRAIWTFLGEDGGVDSTHTFADLDRSARQIAAQLAEVAAPGQRVMLLYPPGFDYLAAFFGCLYAGVIAVPAYPPDPLAIDRSLCRLMSIVRDCDPVVVLTTQGLRDHRSGLERTHPELAEQEWIAASPSPERLGAGWDGAEPRRDDIAFLQYTSGSTGTPKGVMVTHGNLLNQLEALAKDYLSGTSEDTQVSWLPPYHDMGLVGGLLWAPYVKIPVYLMSPVAFLKRPHVWLQAISRYRASVSVAPNFAYELCVRKVSDAQRDRLDLSSWTLAMSGAEQIRMATIRRFHERFRHCGLDWSSHFACYGLAEGTLMVAGRPRGSGPRSVRAAGHAYRAGRLEVAPDSDESAFELVTCGNTAKDQELLIVDPESRAGCGSGEIGEIWLRGPSVARGYWQRPKESEDVFGARLAAEDGADGDARRFMRTGDLGFLHDGELYVTGRLKDLIVINGLKYHPEDLESALVDCHPALRPGCGVAFSIEIGEREELVLVHEVSTWPVDGSEVVETIRSQLRKRHALDPHSVVLLEPRTVSKTSNGKVQRRICRAAFLEGTLAGELWRWRRISRSDSKLATVGAIAALSVSHGSQ